MPGYNKRTPEMIKNKGQEEVPLKAYNRIWKERQTTEEWQKALIVLLFKKGERRDHNKYEGI